MRLTLLLVSLLALAACSSDGDSSTPTPDFAAVSRDAAEDIPLTATDLTGDWDPLSGDAGGLTAGLALSPECDIFDLNVPFPGAAATATGDAFTGGLAQQLTTFGAVYEDPDAAQSAIDGTAEIVDHCGDEFESEVRRIANEQLEALGIDLGLFADIDVGISPIDPPIEADGAAAYRVGVTVGLIGGDQRYTLDVFLLRHGRSIAAATYATFAIPNADDEAAIATTLLENATEAETRLPRPPSPSPTD